MHALCKYQYIVWFCIKINWVTYIPLAIKNAASYNDNHAGAHWQINVISANLGPFCIYLALTISGMVNGKWARAYSICVLVNVRDLGRED